MDKKFDWRIAVITVVATFALLFLAWGIHTNYILGVYN